jgi:hypothetical protein
MSFLSEKKVIFGNETATTVTHLEWRWPPSQSALVFTTFRLNSARRRWNDAVYAGAGENSQLRKVTANGLWQISSKLCRQQ